MKLYATSTLDSDDDKSKKQNEVCAAIAFHIIMDLFTSSCELAAEEKGIRDSGKRLLWWGAIWGIGK